MIKTGMILQRNRFIESNGCSKWIEFFFFENNTAKTENDACPATKPVGAASNGVEACRILSKNEYIFVLTNYWC